MEYLRVSSPITSDECDNGVHIENDGHDLLETSARQRHVALHRRMSKLSTSTNALYSTRRRRPMLDAIRTRAFGADRVAVRHFAFSSPPTLKLFSFGGGNVQIARAFLVGGVSLILVAQLSHVQVGQ